MALKFNSSLDNYERLESLVDKVSTNILFFPGGLARMQHDLGHAQVSPARVQLPGASGGVRQAGQPPLRQRQRHPACVREGRAVAVRNCQRKRTRR